MTTEVRQTVDGRAYCLLNGQPSEELFSPWVWVLVLVAGLWCLGRWGWESHRRCR